MAKAPRGLLFIDDDAFAGRGLARILPHYRVDVVPSRDRALQAAHRHHYDAFLLDVCLGVDDRRGGIELASELRPLSGLENDTLEVEARRVGADAAFQKGEVTARILTDTIETAIVRRSDQREATADLGASRGLQPLIDAVLDAALDERDAHAAKACHLVRLAHAAAAASDRSCAMDLAARAVGLARTTMHGYATVALRWTEPEIEQLLHARRNAAGDPISISHLVHVAKLALGRSQQADLVEHILRESLTVAHVGAIVADIERCVTRSLSDRPTN
jgi:DNA-binding response OmpR family regulator